MANPANTDPATVHAACPHRARCQYARRGCQFGKPGPESRTYLCLGLLGKGRTSRVYKAVAADNGVTVVVKEYLSTISLEERSRCLQAEARALQLVTGDPAAPRYVEHWTWGREHCVVMTFVDGATLADVKLDSTSYSAGDVMRWLVGIAGVTARLHAAGLVYQDLGPSNIVVTPDGDAVLIDFGYVRRAGDPTEYVHWGFAAPDGKLSPAYDVFTLGCVALFAFTGVLLSPEQAAGTQGVVAPQWESEMARRWRLGPAIRAQLVPFLLRALHTVPSARYPTMEALVRALPTLGVTPLERASSFIVGAIALTLLIGAATADIAFLHRSLYWIGHTLSRGLLGAVTCVSCAVLAERFRGVPLAEANWTVGRTFGRGLLGAAGAVFVLAHRDSLRGWDWAFEEFHPSLRAGWIAYIALLVAVFCVCDASPSRANGAAWALGALWVVGAFGLGLAWKWGPVLGASLVSVLAGIQLIGKVRDHDSVPAWTVLGRAFRTANPLVPPPPPIGQQ